ncbi:MAG: hypothetical protein JNN15_04600 [Blastocatellia bacterium]|nr:hypothetical protein [Blastocatellia bacterium]
MKISNDIQPIVTTVANSAESVTNPLIPRPLDGINVKPINIQANQDKTKINDLQFQSSLIASSLQMRVDQPNSDVAQAALDPSTPRHQPLYNPYEGISAQRQTQLDQEATRLLDKYADNDGSISGPYDPLTFTDFGDILNELAARNDLTDREKANVWTQIAGRVQNGEYPLSNEGLPEELRDSFRPETSTGHIVIGFNDTYHGDLAQDSPEEAVSRIIAHEESEGGFIGRTGRTVLSTPIVGEIASVFAGRGVSERNYTTNDSPLNDGDVRASIAQVEALRAFQDGGFNAYAREWNRVFLGR